IKGFRRGKAPLDMVKKLHGEAIEHGALDALANDFYRTAVEERNIHPLGSPVLTDLDYKRGEQLRFRVKYEVKPVITLGVYKGIPVERTVHPVPEAEVNEEILRIRRANSTFAESATATDDEHVVTADIQQLDETGAPLIGKRSADVRLY